MTVEDFRRSAAAGLSLRPIFPGREDLSRDSGTREVVPCNTNLGIILLAAPLQAVQTIREPKRSGLRCRSLACRDTSRCGLGLQGHTLAQPGGLGEARSRTFATRRSHLLEARRIAEHRDRIAYQYTNSFADIFEFAIPSYHRKLSLWGDKEWSAVAVFAGLLKRIPDSHVERKFGARYTRTIASRMTQIDQALSVSDRPEQVMPLLREVDAEFKSCGINPVRRPIYSGVFTGRAAGNAAESVPAKDGHFGKRKGVGTNREFYFSREEDKAVSLLRTFLLTKEELAMGKINKMLVGEACAAAARKSPTSI